jgi:hypothetical protein
VEDRHVVDFHSVADPYQGPADLVEPHCLIDLLGGETMHPHRHAVIMQLSADGLPGDPEPLTEFVHCRAGFIGRDELLDLVVAQPSRSAGLSPIG